MADFKYTIVDDFDEVVDEKGNSFIAIRKIKWGENANVKLDIRKYFNNSDGEEVMGKGVSFITEDGPHTLTETLVRNGYGDTREIMVALSDREDFKECEEEIENKIKDIF